MEDLIESISNEICDKVKSQIDIRKIFKIVPTTNAITLITQGMNVLDKWQKQFMATRMDIESQPSLKRWDFAKQKDIFGKTKYMKQVLEDIQ